MLLLDWSAQIWPRYAAAERLSLAACTWANNIQVVRSRLTVCAVQRHATYKKSFSLSLKSLQVTSRRRLRSSSSALLVPVTRRRPTTLGDRAFAVAGPRACNTLPDFITDCSSTRTFKQYPKTYLYSLPFWAHNNTLFYDCVKRPIVVACAAYDALKLSVLHYITLLPLPLNRAHMLLSSSVLECHSSHLLYRRFFDIRSFVFRLQRPSLLASAVRFYM